MAFVVPSLKNRLPESLPYPFRGTVVCSVKLPGIRESAESVFFPGMSWKHFPVAAGHDSRLWRDVYVFPAKVYFRFLSV